ncbi:hypothetical protein [Kitasatospora cheerisanensis]|uniref:Uncharacterized protein n=1 Tax=Kitasatospora cheerisanensis KCTC 2395 TaxID=1348663 RepID=A0A066YTH3_9ACTN|nr:hypothetical protein [Kitasatospora cheerisanensis]KDN81396.1 hypothetical protein KCH_68430 [Kitasatospora cheerisanensis KCTC 2395]
MHLPDALLTGAAKARIRQAEHEAAKWFPHNPRARHAHVSLAHHVEGRTHAAEVLARLRSQARKPDGAAEFRRRKDLDAATKRYGKADREVEYARSQLLRALRNPGPAPQTRPATPVRPAPAPPVHREPMWIGSHWSRSTS